MSAPFREAPHTLDALERTHAMLAVDCGEPASAYALAVPRTFGRARTITGTRRSIGRPDPIGIFVAGPSDHAPRVLVSVTRLPFEVDPLAWLCARLGAGGWTVAHTRRLPPPWAPRVELGALRDDAGIVEVRRTTAWLDDGRLFRVDVAASAPAWPRVHDLLWPCGRTFSPDRVTGRAGVEARTRVQGPGVAFEHPASLAAARMPEASREAPAWWLTGSDDDDDAFGMGVWAHRFGPEGPAAIEARRSKLRRWLQARGLALARRVEPLPDRETGATPGWTRCDRLAATRGGEPLEVRFAHRDFPDARIGVDALAIAKPAAALPLAHLRATRALAIVGETAEPEPL